MAPLSVKHLRSYAAILYYVLQFSKAFQFLAGGSEPKIK